MTGRPREPRFFTVFIGYWLPVLAYVTAIIALSAQPNLQTPLKFPYSDKVYHVLEYLVLGLLLARALRVSIPGRRALWGALGATIIGIVVGTSDELFQSFIPGRKSSAMDLVADTAGLALAQLLYLSFARD